MMTWSVNWDAVSTCGTADEFAENFETIFNIPTTITKNDFEELSVYPNPASEYITVVNTQNSTIEIYDILQHRMQIKNQLKESDKTTFNISNLSPGIYFIKSQDCFFRFIKH